MPLMRLLRRCAILSVGCVITPDLLAIPSKLRHSFLFELRRHLRPEVKSIRTLPHRSPLAQSGHRCCILPM